MKQYSVARSFNLELPADSGGTTSVFMTRENEGILAALDEAVLQRYVEAGVVAVAETDNAHPPHTPAPAPADAAAEPAADTPARRASTRNR
jgi:hypothetical protein